MSGLACVLWWLVLGGLLGLLGSWLIGRLFRSAMPAPQERIVEKFVDRPVDRPVEKIVEVEKLVETVVERPVEKIVEKLVDNPDHLAKIAALTAEVALIGGLRSRIQSLEATPPKVVEKIIEKPVDRIVEKIVDRPVEKIVEKIVEKPVDRVIEKVVEKVVEKPVDRIVEKLVDNPSQAARIAALTAEVAVIAGLRGRIKQLESTPPKVVEKIVDRPVEKIVEKIVDRPVEKIVEKIVDRPVERIVERIVDRPVEKIVEKFIDRPVEKIVEKIVDRPVDRIVEKLVDNPAQASRIATLTAEVAVIAGLRNRIKQLESTPPKVVEKIVDRPVEKIVEKIVDRPVDRIVEKIVDRPVEKIVEKIVDRPVDSPALLTQVAGLRTRVTELEGQMQAARAEAAKAAMPPPLDLVAAKAAGFTVKGEDDLELIEGIGPKIAELFRSKGIRTFAQLAATPESRLRQILDEAGPNYRIANPGTWAEQADLAARNRWTALRSLQDVLDAGVRVDSKALTAELADLKKKLAGGGTAPVARAERPINIEAAKAAGFNIKGADDLEIIEGIGPKIRELLHAAGIKTFAQLADTTPGQIQPILDKAGANFRLADPQTWPEQSALAAMNHWQALKTLQEALNAGKR